MTERREIGVIKRRETSGKVKVEYRRQMMPGGETYLKPVGGRLKYDKYLRLPCATQTPDKPASDSAIYLPLIKASKPSIFGRLN